MFSAALVGLLRVGAIALTAAGLGTGVYYLAQAGGDGDSNLEVRATVTAPAPSSGEGDWENCGLTADECMALINERLERERATPAPPDPQVVEILQQDTVVQAMVGQLVPGTDYWVHGTSIQEGSAHGDEGAMVTVLLTQPVDYSGTIPAASDPCEGERGWAEYVAPDHPCLQQPRNYGTEQVSYTAVNELHFQVDTNRGEVVRVIAMHGPPDMIPDRISYFQSQPGGGVVDLSAP